MAFVSVDGEELSFFLACYATTLPEGSDPRWRVRAPRKGFRQLPPVAVEWPPELTPARTVYY